MCTKYFILFFLGLTAWSSLIAQEEPFRHQIETVRKPWTALDFDNDPQNFQFAIVSDRTGGHRAGVFGKAMEKLNLLHPEFVMSVGDLIEGYIEDTTELRAQWAEFDSIQSGLNMRFFALPGNHDISNEVMRDLWLERYGHSYYHFRYRDVLFLAFDSNDGDGVDFSREQLDYFIKAIRDNEDVRWTMVFMHHPVWNYREFNGFDEIEAALEDRPYTVVAGHNHRYFKNVRQDRNYYILASTGGGSNLRGPRLGEFDHITWVTMTEEGPELVHLQLGGILADDVLDAKTAPLAMALFNAAQWQPLVLRKSDREAVVYLRVENTLLPSQSEGASTTSYLGTDMDHLAGVQKPLRFSGRFYHNHHIDPSKEAIELQVDPQSSGQVRFELEMQEGVPPAEMDAPAMEWTLQFDGPELEPPFKLSGLLDIPLEYSIDELLSFTPMDVFLESHQVELEHGFQGLEVRYTLDGTAPTRQSPLYEEPIPIAETTTVKARLFELEGPAASEVKEKIYRKVTPHPATANKENLRSGRLRYAYYEGNFPRLPDFNTLSVKKQGLTSDFDVEALAERKDHFAIKFEGYIEVPEAGIYTIAARSDDGSKVYLHGELVVENDGSHSARTRRGNVALAKGLHPIRIEYFEDYLGETLSLQIKGPDGKEIPVEFDRLFIEK